MSAFLSSFSNKSRLLVSLVQAVSKAKREEIWSFRCESRVESLSFVNSVKDLLAQLKAAGVVEQRGLVERLRLVKALAVEGTHLVGVLVAFGGPAGAVPELTVRGVTTRKLSTGLVLDFVDPAVVELLSSVTGAPVRAVMSNEGALETIAEGGR